MRILAVDIGGTNIKAGISENYGEIIEFKEVSSGGKEGKDVLIRNIKGLIREYENYDKVGVSTTGQVDTEKGSISFADNSIPNYTGTNLKEILEKEFKVPVRVENDGYCVALGEKYFGNGKDIDNFIILTYGTGVGGAIVLNSEIYKGFQGNAGEFGSMYIVGEGCYGSTSSTRALVREVNKINSTITEGREIIERVKEGQQEIVNIYDNWLEGLVRGVATLIHILNPQVVVIGGGIMEDDMVLDEVRNRVYNQIDKSFQGVKIEKATYGNKTGLMGAVALHKE